MKKNSFSRLVTKFWHSKRALAIPMTFMILFVSTLGLVSVTYYFAVEKVNARSQTLKVTMARQDFLSLDQDIMSIVCQPGSARTFEISDSGGKLKIQPSANSLTISASDNGDINQTLFSENTGNVAYELPYSDSSDTGLFLKGDSRPIANQSGSVAPQLFIASGSEHPEVRLNYRPVVSCVASGTDGGRAVNIIRIYIINLNTSDSVELYGKVPLRVSCDSTSTVSTQYVLSYSPVTFSITSVWNGATGQVSVPISSTPAGAVINVEVVQTNIKIARSLM
jgi:hypothetical protein